LVLLVSFFPLFKENKAL